jgi:exodeoxyribonuclease VII large subunit
MDVVIVPTAVQGEAADEQIARAIEIADRCRLGDVIIVGRGGGSLEDLLPFSSEVVVRAIAAARTPVISAVGHETDVTLSDLAADVRAPTPSAAAELVSASQTELRARVAGLRGVLETTIGNRLEKVRFLLSQFAAGNLERNVRTFVQPLSQRTDYAREELEQGFRVMLTDRRHRFALAARELASCSPLAVLKRGYAVVTHVVSGTVLVSSERVRRGDALSIRLAQGGLRAIAEEMHAGEK